jgi:hypothetical protein
MPSIDWENGLAYQILPLIIVELSIFEHFNVIAFHEEATIFDDKKWPTNSTGIRVDPDFTITDVSDHGDFSVDDVHLTTQLAKRQHELLGITMNTDLSKE